MAELQRSEVLCVPKRRRLVHSKVKGSEGQDVLHVFYGEKELIFDEPELLPFGNKLLEVDRFPAEEAMSWADGAPYEWDKVRELLEALLDQEILKRATESTAATTARTFPATLGPAPVTPPEPRTFSAKKDQCPFLTREAFGREIELSNLEAIIPVYRVAHPTLDLDGRQVGENSVGPRTLFLDLPTQRRQCNYAGNRYQADLPMNVTALKNMTSRWPEILSLTEQFRTAFFQRLPARGSILSAGEAHLLTVGCLAAVGYVMVRGVEPVANGELDAGLAAMFRIVDGVRLVTTEIMRATAGAHGCELPITPQTISDYAEQYALYYGAYGVCAGPQALIEEYLGVLLDGASAPIQVEPTVATRVGDLDAALDYALHGQQIESTIRIFGGAQGLLHDRLRTAFLGHTPGTRLQELLDAPIDTQHYALLRENHSLRDTLDLEVQVNRWLFARAGDGLPEEVRAPLESADGALTLDPAAQASSADKLDAFLTRVRPEHGTLPEPLRRELAAVAADVFALERRCLRTVGAIQRALNDRLKRRHADRPLTGADFAIYTRPRTGPTFATTLAGAFGLTVTTDAVVTVLSCENQTLSLAD